ncbi:MAG: hypothetical protein ACYS9T_09095 [Planctomycetota bacterium]
MMEHEAKQMVPFISGCFLLFFILVSLIITAVMAWAYCRIFGKAGYPWALGLLMLVPIANIVMPLVLAFGDWPIQKELRLLRQQQNKTTG